MIYTAITGGYNKPRKDIKCFGSYDKFKEPVMNAKIYKVLFHKFIDDEYSIWIDGNVELKHEEDWYYELLEDKDIAVATHTVSKNVYEEAELCKYYNRGNEEEIKEQIEHYKKEGFMNDIQPICSVLIRKNTPEMRRLCEVWWAEICRFSYRDQISFPKVFPKDKVKYLPTQSHNNNEYFKRHSHQ
jgi:hypothetical protein